MPIGPIGILCVSKTITEGRLRGLVIGLGGALSDLLFSSVAAFGIAAVSTFVDTHRFWIRLVGGIFLLVLGGATFRTHPQKHKKNFQGTELLKLFLYTLFLAFTNPLTIFAFISLFATIGIGNEINILPVYFLVGGVFTGSCLWFLLLNSCAGYFGEKLNQRGLLWINRVAGILIVVSGIIAIVSVW